jgi:hypothetical protein
LPDDYDMPYHIRAALAGIENPTAFGAIGRTELDAKLAVMVASEFVAHA